MARPIRTTSLLLALALSAAPAAGAQVAYDSPEGRVEVLGLHGWTLQMLRDSVRKHRPGTELHDAACMVVLREDLGFADALVQTRHVQMRPDAEPETFLVIKVVEPAEAARVVWRTLPADTFTILRPEYAPVVLPVTDSAGGFWRSRILDPLQFYARPDEERAHAFAGPPGRRADAERLFAFLQARRTEVDRRRARAVLAGDRFYVNRMMAAAVLANFPGHDSTWHALADALRDPHEAVRAAAESVLGSLPARPVDWAPARETLRLLLGGTNVGASSDLMRVLAATDIDPALAAPLLRGNAAWILEHARAENPMDRLSARMLLARLSGLPAAETTDEAWARWAAAL
ncbi:MAG TPA: hypothetical protein VFQ45_17175 [Longimicrobium sp.]|nr:hypothetical protein [Longimicrobium sp.]